MKKFYIAIFIFSVCFLDINPAIKSKAFSLREETLISLNDKNISSKLLDLYSDLIKAESYGDSNRIDKVIDQIIAFEEKNYRDKIYEIDYKPVDLDHLIIEKKYQLASYYYENYLVDKIDLVVETYENGILFLEEVPDKDENLKLDYLVLYAKILNEKNNFKKELSIRKEIVDLEAKYNGKKHEYYYDALYRLGIALMNNDEYREANKVLQNLVNISEKENPENLDLFLSELSNSYSWLGDRKNEEKYLFKSLKTAEKNWGVNSGDTALILHSVGDYYLNYSDYRNAEKYLFKALKIQKRFNDKVGEDDRGMTYQSISWLYFNIDKLKKSETYIKKAINIQEKLYGINNTTYASRLNDYAGIQVERGNFSKAFKNYKKAINIYQNLGLESQGIETSYNDLGLAYHKYGDFKKAELYLKKALEVNAKIFGEKSIDYSTPLHNLGLVYSEKGFFQKADELLLEALEITLKEIGENSSDAIVSFRDLASHYYMNGFNDKADKYIQRAIKATENTYGEDNLAAADNYKNFGQILKLNGEFEKAIKFTKKALEIEKKYPKTYFIGGTYRGLASIEESRKNYEKAKLYYKKAEEIYRNSEVKNSWQMADVLKRLAYLSAKEGEFEESIKGYQKALSIFRKIYNEENPKISNLKYQIAYSKANLNKYSESKSLFEEAVLNDLIYLQNEIPLLTTKNRQKFYKSLKGDNLLFDVAKKSKLITKIALLERINKQGLLEEIERRQSNLRLLSKEAEILKNNLKEVNAQISNIKINKKEKDKLIANKEVLEKKFYKLLPTYKPSIVKVEDISKQLKDDEILVEYQMYFPVSQNNKNIEARYIAFTLDNKGNINIFDLGNAEIINSLVSKIINSAENKNKDFDEKLQKIKSLIISPLEKDLANKKNIYLSPDNELNRVPYSAFNIKSEGNNKYAYKNIRVLTSSRELININRKPKNKITKKTLIVANPAFNLKKNNIDETQFLPQKRSIDLRNLRWNSLPGTLKEGKAINKIIKSNLLTDKKATVLNIQNYSSPKLLHIASHSYYLPSKEGENSLLRSGIVLAGANNPFLNPIDDGYLTALEATNLNLEGTDLVVISGCESGQGDIKSGQGVYGLRRSLAVAGAKSQLLSLWKVDDLGTAAFMEAFYKNLDKGIAKDIALKNTQKEFQNHPIPSWRHPYIWAAFQLSGSWKPINF